MSNKKTDTDSDQIGSIARFLFLKPTLAILLASLLSAGGFLAYLGLAKESLPDLDIPQATIVTTWSGADPQSIEQEVTEPIEKEIKSLKGVKSVTSASFDSVSIIAVEFEASAESREAMSLLRSSVGDAEARLPDAAEAPRISQVSVDDRPILSFVFHGDVDQTVLSRYAKMLQDQLERLQGVNEVDLGGARDEVIQILLKPERLLSLGISPTKIRDAVQNANLDMPWGAIENKEIGALVRLSGRFRDIEELKRLPISRLGTSSDGRLIRLGEIADISRQLQRETTRAFFSWKGDAYESSIEVSVKKSPGADTLSVIERVAAELDKMQTQANWPAALRYRITQNESDQIWDSLSGVLNNGWQAMIAVFVILFLLLTWREGLVAGLSIPLSFLGSLILIWALGQTLNELVIIGMVLALGLMVDVFILMMEGMHEAIFVEKLKFNEAALKTVKRYALPAAAGQLTTILALLPLAAISGTAGKFIRVLPLTAIVCLIVSFIVALLVSIPLSRPLLGKLTRGEGKVSETKADKLTARYSKKLLQWSRRSTLRSRRTAFVWVLGAFGVFIVSIVCFTKVPLIMYPQSDGLRLGMTIEMPPSTTLDQSQEVADQVGEFFLSKPYFESSVKLVGRKSPLAMRSLADALRPSTGEHFIGFSAVYVERDQREKPSFAYTDELRLEVQNFLDNHYAGTQLTVVGDSSGPSTAEPIEIKLTGENMDTLQYLGETIQLALNKIAGVVETRDNIGAMQAEISLKPDREAIDFYGITQRDLASQVRYAMGNDLIGKFAMTGMEEDLDIQLGMDWPSREGQGGGPRLLTELSLVRAFTPQGDTVPLLSLLSPYQDVSPVSITHEGARRSISVLAKSSGRPVSAIVAELRPTLEKMKESWPAGYDYSLGGETQETAETFGSAGAMLVIAIILVFAVLVLVFDSFVQSLIILTTMPLAMIGTFMGFFTFGIPFSFFAMVGVIALMGIVANDAIVMVDTMNIYLKRGMDIVESAARGASDRLRPIITTSVTTIVGLVPLALSNPMWRPLCYALILGLVASTALSLVIIPCLYLLFTPKSHQEALENID